MTKTRCDPKVVQYVNFTGNLDWDGNDKSFVKCFKRNS